MNDTGPDPTSAINVSPVLSHTSNADAVIASRDDQPQVLTAPASADLECPENVRVSASGKHAVYCLRPATKTGEYETASYTSWVGCHRTKAILRA